MEDSVESSEPSQPSEPSEPTPPAPSTRAPPRRGPPSTIKRPAPKDPDDEIATVDQANEFSVTARSSSQKVLLAIFGVAGLVVVVLLTVLLWPTSTPDKPVPPPVPKVVMPPPPKVTPRPPPPKQAGMVQVLVRATKGTSMTVDGKPVSPDSIIERPVGELVLKFTCPAKKKVKMTPGTLRAQIPESSTVVAVEVPCR